MFFFNRAGQFVGLVAALVGSVAIFSVVLAVDFGNYPYEYNNLDYEVDFRGLQNLSPEQRCENGDGCLGWCQCSLKLTEFEKDYVWNFFNERNQEEIFNIRAKFHVESVDAATSRFRLDFGSGRACQMTITGGPPQTQAAARSLVEKNQCRFERAFCCCKTDPNGQKSGCYRSVNYNVETRKAQCSDGETPSSETDAGCLSQNDTASKKAGQPDTNVDVSESLGELQQRAAGLNQLEGISQPTAQATLQVWIGRFIGFFFISFVGMFALVFYVYAGVLWLTAAGNAERIERAKKILLWTTLGIMATLASYLVISQVFTFIATGAFSR